MWLRIDLCSPYSLKTFKRIRWRYKQKAPESFNVQISYNGGFELMGEKSKGLNYLKGYESLSWSLCAVSSWACSMRCLRPLIQARASSNDPATMSSDSQLVPWMIEKQWLGLWPAVLARCFLKMSVQAPSLISRTFLMLTAINMYHRIIEVTSKITSKYAFISIYHYYLEIMLYICHFDIVCFLCMYGPMEE